MSFGFSVGDFLAGAKLIADLTRAMSASKGSSMEYQQLILDLQVVETTLVQIDQMRLASQLNTSALNALSWITQSTAASIADFMQRTKKYQESLSSKGSGNMVKDLWKKIGWTMYKPAEIRSLQQRLQLDLGSINCLISLAIRNNSSLETYYDNLDAGSYAQIQRRDLPSYRDEDFRIIVHRRITQEFVVGGKMASFDPTYRLPQDPHSYFRTGQAFAVLLPEQRVYKTNQQDTASSKRTLYLSYQLPKQNEGGKGGRLTAPHIGDQHVSAIFSMGDDDNSNESPGSQATYESRTRNSYIGEAAIRRLIVVRDGITSSLCLPIQTYSGRGCIDQVGKEFFGIVHMSTVAPVPMVGEEQMTKAPVRLNAKHPADSLHGSSRINYRKLYRVDHNVRVKDLGLIDIDSVQTLVRYFEESTIKLTEDLKYNGPDQVEKSLSKETQATDAAVKNLSSKLPKIIVDDDERQGASQNTLGYKLDIADTPQDEQAESIFEFEP